MRCLFVMSNLTAHNQRHEILHSSLSRNYMYMYERTDPQPATTVRSE